MKNRKNAISPTRNEDYPEWYQEVIKAADLAENSPVRGCMVIKPWGFSIWENIKKELDKRFKETGHQNAYFPLFIPKSFLEKEAEHVEGFAKECAVVTHHRLEKGKDGGLVPAGELEEPLVVRPTSETIIGAMFSKWVQSYRDLPLLINQWANIVRWEMRTRMFLRTTEFLWQEGHTVHATEKEAMEETLKMLNVYADFMESDMAMPVIKGRKTESEKFPGADITYSVEAMMQDRKALQSGTSHYLGQNFAKASDIKFLDRDEKLKYAYTTSWGVSTRLVGGLIMVHGDDDGLVLPPKLSPLHVVILPVLPNNKFKNKVFEHCDRIKKQLSKIIYNNSPLKVFVDKSEIPGGRKKWDWVKKGVPIRIEIGPKEIEKDEVTVSRRDTPAQENSSLKTGKFIKNAPTLLTSIQNSLYDNALRLLKYNTKEIKSKEDFYDFFTPRNIEKPEIHGGFVLAYFKEDEEIEKKIQEDLNVSIRCIPLEEENNKEEGKCLFTGKPTRQKVIFGKAY
ncbi:proline--tRNA ligase [candidate division WOR-3 bacterium]|nr:proline--tRNA ligase [candidate division WOR-3 bacterium]